MAINLNTIKARFNQVNEPYLSNEFSVVYLKNNRLVLWHALADEKVIYDISDFQYGAYEKLVYDKIMHKHFTTCIQDLQSGVKAYIAMSPKPILNEHYLGLGQNLNQIDSKYLIHSYFDQTIDSEILVNTSGIYIPISKNLSVQSLQIEEISSKNAEKRCMKAAYTKDGKLNNSNDTFIQLNCDGYTKKSNGNQDLVHRKIYEVCVYTTFSTLKYYVDSDLNILGYDLSCMPQSNELFNIQSFIKSITKKSVYTEDSML